MSEIIMLIFTGVIAASTVIYTIYSIRLWKATRFSTDIARYTLLVNFMLEIHRRVEEAKLMGKPDAFLEVIESILLEQGAESAIKDIDFRKRPDIAELIARFDGMLRANKIDPESIPFLRPIFRKLRESSHR